jgi:hypothetical protein
MGFIGPTKYITSADGATVTGGPIWLQPDNITLWHFQVTWDGDLEATVTVEGSSDPRARQTSGETGDAVWLDITGGFAITNPTGTPGTIFVRQSGAGDAFAWASFVRLVWTNTAGTGALNVWFSGRSS